MRLISLEIDKALFQIDLLTITGQISGMSWLLNANAHTVNTQLVRYCNLPLGIADTQFSATIAPKTTKT